MILKEFRQMRRDRRTMALLFMVPLLMLTVFGYAARFDVKEIPTAVVGPESPEALKALGPDFDVVERQPAGNEASARRLLRDSKAHVRAGHVGRPYRRLYRRHRVVLGPVGPPAPRRPPRRRRCRSSTTRN